MTAPPSARGIMIGVTLMAAIALALGGGQSLAASGSLGPGETALATPPGITIKETRGRRDAAGIGVPGPPAFADHQGHFIYIYARDTDAGDSTCTGACAVTWPPLTAAATAQGNWSHDWSVISRAGGIKQWAYKGNPLYTSSAAPEDTTYKICTAARRGAPAPTAAATKADVFPAEWCVPLSEPANELAFPDGIAAAEAAQGNATVLVESTGRTLYTFAGNVRDDKQTCGRTACANSWTPLAAPELALPRGDFSIVVRADATRQWAYKGRPLYTFPGDLAPGEVNGRDRDAKWQVAALARHFVPAGVGVAVAPGFVTVWTTAEGLTLYQQNRGERRRSPARTPFPAAGACDAKCLETWRPFKAAAGAVASGYWSLVALAGGGQQWAYRDNPLSTFAGDRRPGDMKGKYVFNYLVRDDDGQVIKVAVGRGPAESPNFWRPAFPY